LHGRGGFSSVTKTQRLFKQQIQNVPTKQFEENELLSLSLYGFRGNMKLQKQQNQQHIQHHTQHPEHNFDLHW
jgi:hypothetical protein